MSKPPISQMIAEAEQWLRTRQDEAAKPGKAQSLAQHRLELTTGIVAILKWSRDNADELRAYRMQKGKTND